MNLVVEEKNEEDNKETRQQGENMNLILKTGKERQSNNPNSYILRYQGMTNFVGLAQLAIKLESLRILLRGPRLKSYNTEFFFFFGCSPRPLDVSQDARKLATRMMVNKNKL